MICKCQKRGHLQNKHNCLTYCCDAPFHFKLKNGNPCINCSKRDQELFWEGDQ